MKPSILYAVAMLLVGCDSKDMDAIWNPGKPQTVPSSQQPIRSPDSSTTPVSQAAEPSSVKAGDVLGQVLETTVTFIDCGIGRVPLRDYRGGTESTNDLLWVKILIDNKSASRKMNYNTWNGASVSFRRDYASARDSFGNILKRIDFGLLISISGAVEDSESIYPGKSVGDVLVFEVPVDGSKFVKIELPQENLGGSGVIVFTINPNREAVGNLPKAPAITNDEEEERKEKERESAAERAREQRAELEDRAGAKFAEVESAKAAIEKFRADNIKLSSFLRAKEDARLYSSVKNTSDAAAAAYAKAEADMKAAGAFTDAQIAAFQAEEKRLAGLLTTLRKEHAALVKELK